MFFTFNYKRYLILKELKKHGIYESDVLKTSIFSLVHLRNQIERRIEAEKTRRTKIELSTFYKISTFYSEIFFIRI